MSIAIKAEDLSKAYQLGEFSTGTLSRDIERWFAKIRGKEDPFLKIGEVNDRSQKGESDIVWSLKDINFEIKQGEAVGIIGKNGAGKSTLLKILSRVTTPTTGNVKVKGRIASLLEVGTGFHPELTGRENIYLNGAILGMRKREIQRKFDEIVEFAGVARYIDTPVKRYSSGMYVRLAFAVAAHLESETLIVDEVLAVGDAEFQKKCLGKMKDVSEQGGRTVLFVSHNMLAIKSLCSSGIFLQNGCIKNIGSIDKIIDSYIATGSLSSKKIINKEENGICLNSLHASDNGIDGYFDIDKDLELSITMSCRKYSNQINVNLFFNSADGGLIFASCSKPEAVATGEYTYKCCIPAGTLNDNLYCIDLMVVENGSNPVHHIREAIMIQGNEPKREGSWLGKFPGLIRPIYFNWQKIKKENEYILP